MMEVSYSVEMRGGGREEIQPRLLPMSEKPGIWELEIDVKADLHVEGPRAFEQLVDMCKLHKIIPFFCFYFVVLFFF